MRFIGCSVSSSTTCTIVLLNLALVSAELYSSVEELSSWQLIGRNLTNIIDSQIRRQSEKLDKLKEIKLTFLDIVPQHQTDNNGRIPELSNPTIAFKYLNSLIKAIEDVDEFVEEYEDTTRPENQLGAQFDHLRNEHNFPSDVDLQGSGEAIFRLRAFYGLSIDDIISGKFSDTPLSSSSQQSIQLDSDSCFELAKIAYYDESFSEAMEWFRKSLNLLTQEIGSNLDVDDILEWNVIEDFDVAFRARINDILDYMAFTAYKSGHLRYSADLTNLWLQSDPENDRAKSNLKFYQDELANRPQEPQAIPHDDQPGMTALDSEVYKPGVPFSPVGYDPKKDEVIKSLCRQATQLKSLKSNLGCTKIALIPNMPFEFKVETLHIRPNIIRIYNILSKKEAKHIRDIVSNRLERSTVKTSMGQTTSDFRIAKTSWISSKFDEIVEKVEDRISLALDFVREGSEELQVVNYGLGGYYGPHMDSSRPIESQNQLNTNTSDRDDRLATVLMYLNSIDIGGSTAFPKLNMIAEPVERSAVAWYNLRKDGLSDDLTLHTGCPTLIGSKWIATKWFREIPNSFRKPCGLRPDDRKRSFFGNQVHL